MANMSVEEKGLAQTLPGCLIDCLVEVGKGGGRRTSGYTFVLFVLYKSCLGFQPMGRRGVLDQVGWRA